MYRNCTTGQTLSDDEVDQIVSSWATRGVVGRPRECVIDDLIEAGFEYVQDIIDEPYFEPEESFEQAEISDQDIDSIPIDLDV